MMATEHNRMKFLIPCAIIFFPLFCMFSVLYFYAPAATGAVCGEVEVRVYHSQNSIMQNLKLIWCEIQNANQSIWCCGWLCCVCMALGFKSLITNYENVVSVVWGKGNGKYDVRYYMRCNCCAQHTKTIFKYIWRCSCLRQLTEMPDSDVAHEW